jgi:SAM-dependent methyltransferase
MRREAPAAARNRDPILEVLRQHLPKKGLVLEFASGTGEHVVHFAAALPALTFQPSDPNESARASIDDWAKTKGLGNVRPTLELDASKGKWPVEDVAAIVCINMIHISPWAATVGLIEGAGGLLPSGGVLYLYGPYRRAGIATAPSNEAFDADLKGRNADWGLRQLEEVEVLAARHGFGTPTVIEMPANNLSVVFRKT